MCYPIECPNCEHNYEIDCIEDDYWEETCPNCEEEFKVEVESNPTLITSKFNYKKCLECGNKFDKDWTFRSKFSDRYAKNANVCENCIINLYNEMMDNEKESE
jgi:hypothetical protein